MRVAILGVGHMGQSFARGLLTTGLVQPSDLLLVENSQQQIIDLKASFDCQIETTPASCQNYSFVILAVKPQDFKSAAEALRPFLKPGQVIISLMAGVSLETIRQNIGTEFTLVRSMPNLAASIGQGITAWYADGNIDSSSSQKVEQIFESCGKSLKLEREDLLNAVTALSGSGPAYVFYMIESALAAASNLGLPQNQAEILIKETISGALQLWAQSNMSPEKLRAKVTSKGGTTEAAICVLEDQKVKEALQQAIKRACQRAVELSS